MEGREAFKTLLPDLLWGVSVWFVRSSGRSKSAIHLFTPSNNGGFLSGSHRLVSEAT